MSAIFILGDSTSMTVGVEKSTYPFLLAKAPIWPAGTRFVNFSMPGFTSADAAACFFRHRKSYRRALDAVVLYLGNCDAAATEIRKGKYGRLRELSCWVKEVTQQSKSRTRIKNRLLHFEWNNSYDPTIEVPEDPRDYEYNLGRIIKVCDRQSTPVILVRPKANSLFPPGVGKGNFIFYRYIGMKEHISELLSIPDVRFTEALRHHESNNYSKAAELYQEILLRPYSSLMSQEYPLMILNNCAAAIAEGGGITEAIYLYQLLLNEPNARKEIVLYNLAQLHKTRGEHSQYSKCLEDSYEADYSLYRIRTPYKRAVDRLAGQFSCVSILDMEAVVPDTLYLDHCHPLLEGQCKMAEELKLHFNKLGLKGNELAEIENILYNPEVSTGNPSRFHEYFLAFGPYTPSQIAGYIAACETIFEYSKIYSPNLAAFSSIPKEIRATIEYALRHPFFTSIKDVLFFPPRYSFDVGRFPEFYVLRTVIPYLREHESNAELSSRFDLANNLLRTSEQLLSILPNASVPLVLAFVPSIEYNYSRAHADLIVAKCRELLIQHLEVGNQIFERLKTTIYWYFRETLRFGAHSRPQMLYDRITLEFLAEGLAVAGVLDASTGCKISAQIVELISVIGTAAEIHNTYCSAFEFGKDAESLLQKYDRDLGELAVAMRRDIAT